MAKTTGTTRTSTASAPNGVSSSTNNGGGLDVNDRAMMDRYFESRLDSGRIERALDRSLSPTFTMFGGATTVDITRSDPDAFGRFTASVQVDTHGGSHDEFEESEYTSQSKFVADVKELLRQHYRTSSNVRLLVEEDYFNR